MRSSVVPKSCGVFFFFVNGNTRITGKTLENWKLSFFFLVFSACRHFQDRLLPLPGGGKVNNRRTEANCSPVHSGERILFIIALKGSCQISSRRFFFFSSSNKLNFFMAILSLYVSFFLHSILFFRSGSVRDRPFLFFFKNIILPKFYGFFFFFTLQNCYRKKKRKPNYYVFHPTRSRYLKKKKKGKMKR